MGLLDAATGPLRFAVHTAEGVLRGAEDVVDDVVPVRDIAEIQSHVLGGVEAIKDATEQMAAQLEMLEKLALSLIPLAAAIAPLAEAVTLLTHELSSVGALTVEVGELNERLAVVSEVLAPIAHAEEDLGKLGHLFSRRRAPVIVTTEPQAKP